MSRSLYPKRSVEASATPSHTALASVFNHCFEATYGVRCLGGFLEPEYLPAQVTKNLAELRYTRDYAASVLHEIAHWCVAGSRRRELVDFGYPYLAPPRNLEAQERFFALELQVQTLEAWFAKGTGVRFVASADNLACPDHLLQRFASLISQRLDGWDEQSPPPRAQCYVQALAAAGLGRWPATTAAGAYV